jgi:NAD(P)-dependent dehydrogenase (short-subunit alcohol dehydrogenase family)
MDKLLNDKVCIITGAGKGFGKDLASVYLSHGARLGLITRSQADLDIFKSELSVEQKQNCFMMAADVSDENSVHAFINATHQRFGKIDVLVNNAGMRFRRPFLEITAVEFKNVMENNFFSMVYMSQAVLPFMKKAQAGKIINMSSVAGNLGLADLSGYISSKAAIIGLTKALAIEFAPDNIQINAIAPGFSKTSYFDNFQKNSPLYQFTLDRIPMKRWGESIEIANACLFLSSMLSDYVTGDVLNVDGGWSAW